MALDSNSAAVICENETLANGYSLKSCQIYVVYAVDSLQVGLIQLKYNASVDLTVKGQAVQTATFDTQFETIALTGYDQNYGHSLTVSKKAYQQTLRLNADIRYWPAFGDDDA